MRGGGGHKVCTHRRGSWKSVWSKGRLREFYSINQQPVHSRGTGAKNPKILRTYFMDAPYPWFPPSVRCYTLDQQNAWSVASPASPPSHNRKPGSIFPLCWAHSHCVFGRVKLLARESSPHCQIDLGFVPPSSRFVEFIRGIEVCQTTDGQPVCRSMKVSRVKGEEGGSTFCLCGKERMSDRRIPQLDIALLLPCYCRYYNPMVLQPFNSILCWPCIPWGDRAPIVNLAFLMRI